VNIFAVKMNGAALKFRIRKYFRCRIPKANTFVPND
jgi:hypothetical protein